MNFFFDRTNQNNTDDNDIKSNSKKKAYIKQDRLLIKVIR